MSAKATKEPLRRGSKRQRNDPLSSQNDNEKGERYERVGIQSLDLEDDEYFCQQTSILTLPVTFGRVKMARMWWKSCDKCSAYEESQQVLEGGAWKPTRFCAQHCRPLAKKVRELSKTMIRITTDGTLENCAKFPELVTVEEIRGKTSNNNNRVKKKIFIGEAGGATWMSFQLEFLVEEKAATEAPVTPKKRKQKAVTPTPRATARALSGNAIPEQGWHRRLRSLSPDSVLYSDKSSQFLFPATGAALKIRQSKQKQRNQPKSLKFSRKEGSDSDASESSQSEGKDSADLDKKLPAVEYDNKKSSPLKKPAKRAATRQTNAHPASPSKKHGMRLTEPNSTAHPENGRQVDARIAAAKPRSRPPNVLDATQSKIVTPRKTNLSKPLPINDNNSTTNARRELFHRSEPNTARPTLEVIVENPNELPTQSTLSDRSRSNVSLSCSRGADGQLELVGQNKRKRKSISSVGSSKKATQGSEMTRIPLGVMQGCSKSRSSSQAAMDNCHSASNERGIDGVSAKKRKSSQSRDRSSVTELAAKSDTHNSRENRGSKEPGEQMESAKDEEKLETCAFDVLSQEVDRREEMGILKKQSQPNRNGESACSSSYKSCASRPLQQTQFSQPRQSLHEGSSSGEGKHLEKEFDREGSSGLSLSKSPVIDCEQESQPTHSSGQKLSLRSRAVSNDEIQSQADLGRGVEISSVSFKGLADTGASCASSTNCTSHGQLSQPVQSQMMKPLDSQQAPDRVRPKKKYLMDMEESVSFVGSAQARSQPVQLTKYRGDSGSDSDDSSALDLPCFEKQPSTQTSLVLLGMGTTQSQVPRRGNPEKARQLQHWQNLQRTGAGTTKASRAMIEMVVEVNRVRGENSEPFWLPSVLDNS